jgi:alpha/beta superfamily hydrolase
MDDDFDDIVPILKALECDNLEIIVLDGVDHDFTGKVDDFIALIDLI